MYLSSPPPPEAYLERRPLTTGESVQSRRDDHPLLPAWRAVGWAWGCGYVAVWAECGEGGRSVWCQCGSRLTGYPTTCNAIHVHVHMTVSMYSTCTCNSHCAICNNDMCMHVHALCNSTLSLSLCCHQVQMSSSCKWGAAFISTVSSFHLDLLTTATTFRTHRPVSINTIPKGQWPISIVGWLWSSFLMANSSYTAGTLSGSRWNILDCISTHGAHTCIYEFRYVLV